MVAEVALKAFKRKKQTTVLRSYDIHYPPFLVLLLLLLLIIIIIWGGYA
jgi:energy-coupling factor transporter transmembrane protein EcfT